MTILLLLTMTLSGCGKRIEAAGDTSDSGSDGSLIGDSVTTLSGYRPAPRSCQSDDMKTWILDSMLDYYLFYDQVDSHVNLPDYDDLQTLVSDLRVAPNDTFSYITDEKSHSSQFDEGEYFGFGWRLSRTPSDDYYFKLVEAGSPLDRAGVQRGDMLTAINGLPTIDFLRTPSAARDAVIASDDTPATADFTIESSTGEQRTISVSKALYPLKTVLQSDVIEHNGSRIAYLHYYQFLNTSAEELATTFHALAAQDPDELVLDLRYNFGGRVMIANDLASYLVGQGKTDQAFAIYQPNTRYRTHGSSIINFVDQIDALQLSRLFVLQTGDTCSASELIVNGLRPFMEVITVGETSCGKPYASIANSACGKVLNALELEAVNAAGAGGYHDGIAADCPASDNLGQVLGNSMENLLAAALSYMDTGSCQASTARSRPGGQALPALPGPANYGVSTF